MKYKRPEAPGQASITTEEGELTAGLEAVPFVPEYVTKYAKYLVEAATFDAAQNTFETCVGFLKNGSFIPA